MSTYELWEKMIKGKVYTKETALKRVTVMGPVFTDSEFEALIALIDTTYAE